MIDAETLIRETQRLAQISYNQIYRDEAIMYSDTLQRDAEISGQIRKVLVMSKEI